jgi:hypothetical protein
VERSESDEAISAAGTEPSRGDEARLWVAIDPLSSTMDRRSAHRGLPSIVLAPRFEIDDWLWFAIGQLSDVDGQLFSAIGLLSGIDEPPPMSSTRSSGSTSSSSTPPAERAGRFVGPEPPPPGRCQA